MQSGSEFRLMKYQTLSRLVSNAFLAAKMKVLGYNSLDEQAFLKEQVLVEVQEPSCLGMIRRELHKHRSRQR